MTFKKKKQVGCWWKGKLVGVIFVYLIVLKCLISSKRFSGDLWDFLGSHTSSQFLYHCHILALFLFLVFIALACNLRTVLNSVMSVVHYLL